MGNLGRLGRDAQHYAARSILGEAVRAGGQLGALPWLERPVQAGAEIAHEDDAHALRLLAIQLKPLNSAQVPDSALVRRRSRR